MSKHNKFGVFMAFAVLSSVILLILGVSEQDLHARQIIVYMQTTIVILQLAALLWGRK